SPLADPPLGGVQRVQHREEQGPVRTCFVSTPNHTIVGHGLGSEQPVHGAALLLGGRRRREMQVHQATPASSLSIRIAVALNSAVPDFGSAASIVSRFVSTSSGKCSV